MPIGKLSKSKGNGFTAAAEYDLAQGRHAEDAYKKKPVVVHQNHITSLDHSGVGEEMREVSSLSSRCKNPVLKFSISFDPAEKISREKQLKFTLGVIKEMGLTQENYQYMVTEHTDKPHPHHHVLANRVGLDGIVLSDSFTKYRLETAIDKMEKKMRLNNKLAATRRVVYDRKSENGYRFTENHKNSRSTRTNIVKTSRDAREGVEQKLSNIQRQAELLLHGKKLTHIQDLQDSLAQQGIQTTIRFNNAGSGCGLSFRYDGVSTKGSDIGLSYAKVTEQLESNKIYHHRTNNNEVLDKKELAEKAELDKLEKQYSGKQNVYGDYVMPKVKEFPECKHLEAVQKLAIKDYMLQVNAYDSAQREIEKLIYIPDDREKGLLDKLLLTTKSKNKGRKIRLQKLREIPPPSYRLLNFYSEKIKPQIEAKKHNPNERYLLDFQKPRGEVLKTYEGAVKDIHLQLELAVSNRAKSPEELKDILSLYGIEYKFHKRNGRLVQGTFELKGTKISGSKVGYKASVLQKAFDDNVWKARMSEWRGALQTLKWIVSMLKQQPGLREDNKEEIERFSLMRDNAKYFNRQEMEKMIPRCQNIQDLLEDIKMQREDRERQEREAAAVKEKSLLSAVSDITKNILKPSYVTPPAKEHEHKLDDVYKRKKGRGR